MDETESFIVVWRRSLLEHRPDVIRISRMADPETWDYEPDIEVIDLDPESKALREWEGE